MTDPDMARSRALVLGTMYPPASAAEGRTAARARMSLRMVDSPLRRDAQERRVGVGEQEGGGIVLRLLGDAASAAAVGNPIAEEAVFHDSAGRIPEQALVGRRRSRTDEGLQGPGG